MSFPAHVIGCMLGYGEFIAEWPYPAALAAGRWAALVAADFLVPAWVREVHDAPKHCGFVRTLTGKILGKRFNSPEQPRMAPALPSGEGDPYVRRIAVPAAGTQARVLEIGDGGDHG